MNKLGYIILCSVVLGCSQTASEYQTVDQMMENLPEWKVVTSPKPSGAYRSLTVGIAAGRGETLRGSFRTDTGKTVEVYHEADLDAEFRGVLLQPKAGSPTSMILRLEHRPQNPK